MSATCTATICFAGSLRTRLQRSAAGHQVPDVQQQAEVRRGHHVQQQRQGVEVVDELEGPVAAEVFGGLEADGQPHARRPQRRADVVEAAAVELEVLVVGARVAGGASMAVHRVQPNSAAQSAYSGSFFSSFWNVSSSVSHSSGRGNVPMRILALWISRRA